MPSVDIYTDGACSGNPGPGGWAAVLRSEGKQKIVYGSEPNTTNNQMELMAVIEGLSALKTRCQVTIWSDSKYVIEGYTKWLPGWIAKNWKNSKKQAVKNVELWKQLQIVAEKHDITWEWVKGHNGHEFNEMADKYAVDACKNQSSSTPKLDIAHAG